MKFSKKEVLAVFLIALLLLVSGGGSVALAQKLIPIPSDLFETEDSRGNVIKCALEGGKYISGTIKGEQFLTDRAVAAQKKTLIKKAKTAKKKAAAQKNYKSAVARANTNELLCKAEYTGEPIATPTPTPTVQGCFDSSGNAKSGAFGISTSLTGNVTRGGSIWNSGGSSPAVASCKGCHAETSSMQNRTYGQYSALVNGSPMFLNPAPSSQQLADITAYLNRNNTSCP